MRFAVAPVATTSASHVMGSSGANSRYSLKGREERSTRKIVSVKMRVPQRMDCSLNLSMSSGPLIPSGKPG